MICWETRSSSAWPRWCWPARVAASAWPSSSWRTVASTGDQARSRQRRSTSRPRTAGGGWHGCCSGPSSPSRWTRVTSTAWRRSCAPASSPTTRSPGCWWETAPASPTRTLQATRRSTTPPPGGRWSCWGEKCWSRWCYLSIQQQSYLKLLGMRSAWFWTGSGQLWPTHETFDRSWSRCVVFNWLGLGARDSTTRDDD